MSPLQLQVVKLLGVTSIELEDVIRKEIEENPALEEGREEADDFEINADETEEFGKNEDDVFNLEDYFGDDEDTPDYKLSVNNYSPDNERNEVPTSAAVSFHEHLLNQLGERTLSADDCFLAEYIIGNIDDDGYLKRSAEEMADDILFQTSKSVAPSKIADLIEIIQDFDPTGVGARNLQECLLLQINRKIKSREPKNDSTLRSSFSILHSCFDDFSKRHYDKIIKKLNISEEELKQAIAEITKLNPKPGNAWDNLWEKKTTEITPDFVVENINGELVLSLCGGDAPELRVNKTYSEMLQSFSESKKQSREAKDAVVFVKQKLDAAKWFIEAVKQRQNTLLTTMNAIVRLQKDYFLTSDGAQLKPMIMKDVADVAGFDISTISRVCSNRYVETDFGIFPLKHFFTEAAQTESGEEVSTREIKNLLAEYINNEDKRQPLTDDTLAAMLKTRGFITARRTVAKYRDQLGIPVARLRKDI
ncbi:RNA polymerase sigma-54 factor [Bacteroidia bacterium]|nr:RNA polymerase sigma-54 factor [Bacteroidia bacterium]